MKEVKKMENNKLEDERSIIDKILQNNEDNLEDSEDSPEISNNSQSISLLYKNGLLEQINDNKITPNKIQSRKIDFLKNISEKILLLKVKKEEDTETIKEIDNYFRSLLCDLLERLENLFEFDNTERGIPSLTDEILSELELKVRCLYQFLIIERIDNISSFLSNRIINNKKEFINLFKSKLDSKKNISLASLKNTLKNYDDMIIIFFIEDIIEMIVSQELTFSELINALEEEYGDEISIIIVKNIVDEDNTLFVKKYLEIINYSPEVLKEFSRLVILDLMQYFPKKEREKNNEE
jgi:hypothetical protein